MDLTFENFKRELPAQILERGRAYLKDGAVTDLDMIDDMHWTAQVIGSDTYDVDIEQLANGTLACSCTCPYEHGEYCKHVAAVLYAIEERFSDQLKPRKRKASTKRAAKKVSLRDLLTKTSQPELAAVLLELAEQDKRIANQLMVRFGAVKPDKAAYSKLVKDALRAHMDHGFLDYQGSRRAASAVLKLVEQANHMLEQGQWEASVASYRAVVDNVAAAINQADDSDGMLGQAIGEAIDGLRQAATQGTEEQEQALFTDCLTDAQAVHMRGWDWRWGLLNIAADLISTPEQRQQLFAFLDQFQVPVDKPKPDLWREIGFLGDHLMSRFDAERAASIKLAVIDRLDGDKAAEKFISEHIQLDRFRQMMIERLMKRGDLKQAKELITQGISINEQQKLPGLVFGYQQMLLKIAVLEKDTPTVIRLARDLLLNGRDYQYYDLLKEAIPTAEWAAFTDSLIKDAQSRRYLPDFVLWLYAREERWSDMLRAAKEYGWTESIERYRQELETRFPAEVAAIYEQTAYKMLEPATDRGVYRMACLLLTRMKELGQGKRADEIVRNLKQRFPKRRSLLEELAKV